MIIDKGVELAWEVGRPFNLEIRSADRIFYRERNHPEMNTGQRRDLAIFYCQNVPEGNEYNRQNLEKIYGKHIRLFSIPCAGRLEYSHLLKALEEFADALLPRCIRIDFTAKMLRTQRGDKENDYG